MALSEHSSGQMQRKKPDGEALAARADYCAFGLFIPSPSPGARRDRVEKARLRLGVVVIFTQKKQLTEDC